MSDHAWVQEHVAAYLAGGLDAQEAERLEAHARECPECAAALERARRLDSGLLALFADAHPAPGLEDRAIARMRAAPERKRLVLNRRAKWAMAAAAVLLLGVIGGVASNADIGLPGESAAPQPTAGERALFTTRRDSLDPNYTNRLDKATVDAAVSQDNIGQPNSPYYDSMALGPPGSKPADGIPSHKSDPGMAMGGMQPGMMGQMGMGMGMGMPPGNYGPLPIPPVPSAPVPLPSFDPTKVRPEVPGPVEPGAGPDPKAQPKNPSDPKPADPKNPDPSPEPMKRIVIRSGDMEFEVTSFDTATETITKLVREIKGAFVGTVNSDKLPNGRVKGSVTVRVPPEQLDGLVLDLRRELGKIGELKGVKLASQDVTKMYADLESRLRAARTMETRLLQIIKDGKGEIEQLLKAEKEVGVWRTKVEELEGEIRYYANLAAFSTLTIVLTEKEIRAAAAITERERVQAGVEVEDVDKAYQQLLAAVVDAKGRITKSELKQLSAGQFNATFNFEVAADSSGPIRDRLRMLGRIARLEIDRSVQTENGTPPSDAKPKRGDTVFLVQLYNLANVAARETATLQIAVTDVPKAYQALRDVVAKTTGRVLVAQLNEQDRQNITAELDFEVRRAEEGGVRIAVDTAGDILARQVSRAAESDSVTDTKVLYKVSILPASRLKPREVATLQVAATDVPAAYQTLRDAVTKATGRVLVAQLNEQDRQNITAQFEFEVRRTDEAAVRAALDAAGDVLSRQVTRAGENEGATDTKVLYKVSLLSANRLRPRETATLSVEVKDVDGTASHFAALVAEAKGRPVDAKLDRDATGNATANLVFEVPLTAAPGVLDQFRRAGTVRTSQSIRDPQATEGRYATARIHVTLTNTEAIVPEGSGLWPKVRQGLSISASVLLRSVTWVVFGLCVVLPWALLGLGGYRIVRRFVQPAAPAPAVPPATPTPPPSDPAPPTPTIA